MHRDYNALGKFMIRDTSAQDIIKTNKPKKAKYFWSFFGVCAVVLSAFLLTQLQDVKASISKSDIRTAKVILDTFIREITATGYVVATDAPTLYSSATGQIRFIKRPGEPVNQGELVAKVTSPELTNLLQQQIATLQKAEIQLKRMNLQLEQERLLSKKTVDLATVKHMAALREFNRAKSAVASHIISKYDFDEAADDLAAAELELANAKKEASLHEKIRVFEYQTKELELEQQKLVVAELKRKKSELNIKSPVEGMMGSHLLPQHSSVTEYQPVLTVVDLSAFEAELEIPQAYAEEIMPGMAVEIRLNGESTQGQIRSISPEVKGNNVLARMRFIDLDALNIRQNQRFSARIVLESRPNTLQVAKGAFVKAGNSAYVIENGIAQKRTVELGSRSLNRVEVLKGLKPGEEIIVSSVESFKNQDTIFLR